MDIRCSNLPEFIEYFNGSKKLKSGSEGTCYKIGNKTYKLYNSFYKSLLNNDREIERLLRFRDVIVNNIYFIRGLIYYNNEMIGSITDYAKGIDCGYINLHRKNIDKIIKALSVLKKDIYELSRLGIYVDDVYLCNILYDNINFKLIDTASYISTLDKDISVIYRKNMKQVIRVLFRGITDKIYSDDNFIYAFLEYIDSPYKDYLEDIDLIMNPDMTIKEIKNIIEEYTEKEIVSFSNCRSDLLRIRKK